MENKKSFIGRDIVILVIGTILGAVISFGSTMYWENQKEAKAKKSLTQMLYTDVLNNTVTLYVKLDRINYNQALRVVLEKKEFFVSPTYDLSLIDAYRDKVSSLHHKLAARILAFYGELRHINYVIHLFQNREIKLNDDIKKFWVKYLYAKNYKCIRNGKEILRVLETKYSIDPKPFDQVKEVLNNYHKKVLESDPGRKVGKYFQIDYYDPAGKRVRQNFKKKKDAVAELAKRQALISENRYLDVKTE